MALVTWEVYIVSLGKGDILTITIRELNDGVPVVIGTSPDGVDIYQTYSAKFHKSHPANLWAKELKTIILADRAKQAEEVTLQTKLDVSDFETYINT